MSRPASSRLAARAVIAQTLAARNGVDAISYAERRWRGDSPVSVVRAGVPGTEASGWSVSARPAELLQAALDDAAYLKLGVREVPPLVSVLAPSATLTASWVAEGKGIPAAAMGAAGSGLRLKKLGVLIPVTLESLESEDYRAERIIEGDIKRAIVAALDAAMLDASNSGDDATPAALTSGAPSLPGTGDPVADLLALAAAFPGNLARASVVTDPQTALELALWGDTSGPRFFDAGVRGGTVAGFPLIVSAASPRDSGGGQLALIAGEGVAACVEDVKFFTSGETLIEQDSAPQGASDTPVAASSTFISAFQEGLVVIKGVIRCNWQRVLPCVAVATGCTYA